MDFRFWLTSIQLMALILLLLHNSGDTFQSSFILLLSCWIYWNYWCSFQEFILQISYRITKTFSQTCPISFFFLTKRPSFVDLRASNFKVVPSNKSCSSWKRNVNYVDSLYMEERINVFKQCVYLINQQFIKFL